MSSKHNILIAAKDSVWVHLRSVRPLHILLATWLFAIAYAFPGYMNWDACEQLSQARAGGYGDGHPPLMAAMWRFIERIVHGPFGMLVLQTSLFLVGLYALFRQRFQPRTAAVVAGLVFLFPPVLTPMTAVWKDAQMAGALLGGTMLAMRRPWVARLVGIALLFYAVGVRHNAPAALPPLLMLVAWSWGIRRKLVALLVALGLTVALAGSAMTVNAKISVRQYWWYRSIALHDLIGTICLSDPMTDDEVRSALAGVPLIVQTNIQAHMCQRYTPREWFPTVFGEGRIFNSIPDKDERLARGAAWNRVLREHPYEWLSHRWLVMREVIGLTDSDVWEPVCQDVGANPELLVATSHNHSLSWFQTAVGGYAVRLGKTIAYRPWAYLLVGLFILAYAIAKRDGMLIALLTSGILYEASFFPASPSPDFRYSHWMVTCCTIAIVIVFLERLRAGRASRQQP